MPLEGAPPALVEPAWPASPLAPQSASLAQVQVAPMHAKPSVHTLSQLPQWSGVVIGTQPAPQST